MADAINAFQQFIALFDALRRATNDNPKALDTFYHESKVVRNAADATRDFVLFNDFERRVFGGDRKLFRNVPPEFESAWHRYKDHWADELEAARLGPAIRESIRQSIDKTFADVDLSELAELAKIKKPARERSPDYDSGEEFDPLQHNGGLVLLQLLSWFSERYDEEPPIGPWARSVDSASDYLAKSIGIDLRAVFFRWKNVPVIFVPRHVADRHGDQRDSLYDLLRDAVRAYVCGAPAASVAMCRALVELVLKQHYFGEEERKGENGYDRPLRNLIILAEKRYEHVKQADLKSQVATANRVLHNYTAGKPLGAAEQDAILLFLRTIKSLIENAPPRTVLRSRPDESH